MFLKTYQLSRLIGAEFRTAYHLAFGTNHISKRYAGHSEYANRKDSKEAGLEKRLRLYKKYQHDINREIRISKNGNPATNTKLQAILGEAMKNNVSKAQLENIIKKAVAGGTLDSDCINAFIFSSTFGILSVIEVSCTSRETGKAKTVNVMKKFGFQIIKDSESPINSVGLISCKPMENVTNILDKAVEDAILANCEEVRVTEDNLIEFQCQPEYIQSCAKKLTELDYKIENSETKYLFPELISLNDETVLSRLDKMEQKLREVPGFVRIVHNVE